MQHPYEGCTIIILILQIRIWRHKEATWFYLWSHILLTVFEYVDLPHSF